jgi:hypothetical protein
MSLRAAHSILRRPRRVAHSTANLHRRSSRRVMSTTTCEYAIVCTGAPKRGMGAFILLSVATVLEQLLDPRALSATRG